MFIAALFMIVKTWTQPKCPSTDEWIKMRFLYTIEYYSAIKKKEVLPFLTVFDSSLSIMLREISQTEKKQITFDLIVCGIKNKQTSKKSETQRTDWWLPEAAWSRGQGV